MIDLSVGDPDAGVSAGLLKDAFAHAAKDPANTLYPHGRGKPALREAIAAWMRHRHGVSLDPASEIGVLMGSKEGLAHCALATLDPGDRVYLGDLTYPVYKRSAALAGAKVEFLAMRREHGYLMDFSHARGAKAIYVNYPNNPTGAAAPKEYFKELVAWAKKRGVFIISDAAYTEVYFNDRPPTSILEIPGAKDVAIEFHSFSKTFGLPGLRIGFACGNKDALAALFGLKETFDSGASGYLQSAAYHMLTHRSRDRELARLRGVYGARRALFENGLSHLRVPYFPSVATFYVWADLPGADFVDGLREGYRVGTLKGKGFGAAGEACLRFALCAPETKLK